MSNGAAIPPELARGADFALTGELATRAAEALQAAAAREHAAGADLVRQIFTHLRLPRAAQIFSALERGARFADAGARHGRLGRDDADAIFLG